MNWNTIVHSLGITTIAGAFIWIGVEKQKIDQNGQDIIQLQITVRQLDEQLSSQKSDMQSKVNYLNNKIR